VSPVYRPRISLRRREISTDFLSQLLGLNRKSGTVYWGALLPPSMLRAKRAAMLFYPLQKPAVKAAGGHTHLRTGDLFRYWKDQKQKGHAATVLRGSQQGSREEEEEEEEEGGRGGKHKTHAVQAGKQGHITHTLRLQPGPNYDNCFYGYHTQSHVCVLISFKKAKK